MGRDEKYFQLLKGALRVCAQYKPMFGKGRKGGVTLEQFQRTYGSDPFYKWVGLDSELMYAAHKAAGGMTSIYRQLGIGCQWIFSSVLEDTLRLSAEQARWTYQVPMPGGKQRNLSLDGRIRLSDIKDRVARSRVERWILDATDKLRLPSGVSRRIKGAVFEVRQGYKSMDSKRQNADIANASNAYANLYMPVLLLLSTQIDEALIIRYTQARWLLLTGNISGSNIDSSYAFCREAIGYDLGGFFERNSMRIKGELKRTLAALLQYK